MWEYYVVGALEAIGALTSVIVLCRFPPTLNEMYYSSYALRPPPTMWKQLFYVVCMMGFLAVLVADIWNTTAYCLNSYSTWNFALQIIYWSWSLQDPGCTSRGRLVLFDVIFPTSFFVTLVTWLVLYPLAGDARNDLYLNWISLSQHGANSALLLFEFLWSDARSVGWSTGAWTTLFPTVYAMYAWSLHATHPESPWVYPFLKVDEPASALWYLAMLLLHVALFAAVCCMAACKVRIIEQTPERIHLLARDVHLQIWN